MTSIPIDPRPPGATDREGGGVSDVGRQLYTRQNHDRPLLERPVVILERETRLELATSTLARLRSTN